VARAANGVTAVAPGNGASTGLQLRLLDCFELRRGNGPVPLPLSAQRLLAFLALQPGPVQRLHVAGMLWIDSSETRAFGSLRSALWRAQQAGCDVVESTKTHLRLGAHVSVDFREGSGLARSLLTSSTEPVDVDWTPLAGDLLPDWYEDWILLERERYNDLALEALEALAERLLAEGRPGRALEVALAAVAREPLRESSHRILVRIHQAEGNPAAALRRYNRYEQLVYEELRLRPSGQMDELVAALLA
jgi:DNA-binding SARP family transcriptional activator